MAAPTPYPVSLMVAGRPCLVVGGGPIAARKVAGLRTSGALVTVVAPEVVPAIGERPDVTVHRRPYEPGEAARYRLVVTATGVAEVDAAVAEDADAAGVWVNSADDAGHCTFLLPSVHRDGPVTVAVSTGGASPALATWLRRRIGASVGGGLGALAELLDGARRRLQAEGRSTESVDWQGLLDGPFPDLVRHGRRQEADALLERALRGGPP